MKRWWVLLMTGWAFAGWAQDTDRTADRQDHREQVQAEYREHLEQYRDHDDRLVLPGLIANRSTKQVRIRAEATGLDPRGVVEFFLIGENSNHAYESLAVAFAAPGDVHKALCFIGMTPGQPADPSRLRFWPKGERVFITFKSGHQDMPVRAEQLVLDIRTGQTLRSAGFVFTGSTGFESGDEPGSEVYAADRYDPMSIASTYNEPLSVLDVPEKAPQNEMYEQRLVNAETVFDSGELLEILLEPEHKDGRKRVIDLVLKVRNAPSEADGVTNAPVQNQWVFELLQNDETLYREAPLDEILKQFVQWVEHDYDPFVTLRFDDHLAVGDIHRISRVLATIDTSRGIRIEGPLKGRLYYKAFLPDDSFRDREKRISQPWELRLKEGADGLTGVLTEITQSWDKDQVWPDLTTHHYAVPTPEALRQELDQRGPGLPVILIFAEPTIPYGDLLRFIQPVLPTHGTVYVFSDLPPEG